VTAPLPELRLYTRPGCHLCEEARDAIQSALEDRAARGLPIPPVVEVDIEADPELHRRYLERIPVVEIDGRRLELLVTAGKLRRMLADVLDATTV
jgi:glutaredoxin